MEDRSDDGLSHPREPEQEVSGEAGRATGSGRARWRAYGLLVGALLVLGFATWEPMPVGIWHDDGVYVLLGRSLAEGQGLTYGGVTGTPPATKFPPLYPAMVSIVWRLAPEFPENVRVISAINLVLLAFAGGLFAALCHQVIGLSLTLSLLTAGVAWTSLELWRVAAIPLSESLFLVLLLASIHWGDRAERSASLGAWLLAFLGFALVVHVRTVGVAMGAAIVLSALSRRKWGRAAVLGVGVLAVMLPWSLWSGAHTPEIALPVRDILGSYGAWLGDQVAVDPISFVAGLPRRLVLLGDWCLTVMLPYASPGVRAALGVPIVPLLAIGLWELGRRSRLAGLTVWMLLAALWIWPFLDRRLLAPMVPWLTLMVILGSLAIARRVGAGTSGWAGQGRVPLTWGRSHWPALFVLGWALYFVSASTWGLQQGRHEAGYRIRAQALASAVEAVGSATEPTAVVGAPELWAGVHLYTGRTVAPSAPFRPGATPPWGSPEDQFRLWDTMGLDHVLVEHGGRVHGAAMDRLDEACPDGAVAVVASYEGAFLVRLGWDQQCRDAVMSP